MPLRPLPFILPDAAIFWAAYLWAFVPELRLILRSRASAARRDSADRGSFSLIIAGQGLAILLAFALAFHRPTQLSPGIARACFWIGVALLVAGSLLRRHCWRMLGDYFTADVIVQPGQLVIDRGAYAWVRHPSYSAGIAMFAGIGLALGNWASFLVVVAVSLVVYHYRMRVEEHALEATLGEPYRVFMHSRKRLIPFVY